MRGKITAAAEGFIIEFTRIVIRSTMRMYGTEATEAETEQSLSNKRSAVRTQSIKLVKEYKVHNKRFKRGHVALNLFGQISVTPWRYPSTASAQSVKRINPGTKTADQG